MTSTFRDVTSANADLATPELTVTCADDVVTVESNGIPDFVYIETSPGDPQAVDLTFRFPVNPTEAADPGEVPALGALGVAIDGVPIYGPTEGSGADVLSLEGGLSECGSHNGPGGFHFHLFGWATGVDCLYSAEVVEAGDSVVIGWAVDGYPIMSGLC